MPKLLKLPKEHPLLIKQNKTVLNRSELEAFMKNQGDGRLNKPYIGVDKEDNGDEYLVVGYFKGVADQKIMAIRKINVADFEKIFSNNLDEVVKRLVNIVMISIDGILTYESVTNYKLENNDDLCLRPEAVTQIKQLAQQKHLKLELFIEEVDIDLLQQWLIKIFAETKLKTLFNKIHIIKNIKKADNILYETVNDITITGVANIFIVNNSEINGINLALPPENIISIGLTRDAHWVDLAKNLEAHKIISLLLYYPKEDEGEKNVDGTPRPISPSLDPWLHYSSPSSQSTFGLTKPASPNAEQPLPDQGYTFTLPSKKLG